uniref:Uncharacterized protein n=1 Tax=Oryza sativa subsp. japonica TaxID=39947 RepID=H2KW53_ORYSJ|nr:hypothetical protein LOC_Os11g19454 [Oryza sativa Japonica Group]
MAPLPPRVRRLWHRRWGFFSLIKMKMKLGHKVFTENVSFSSLKNILTEIEDTFDSVTPFNPVLLYGEEMHVLAMTTLTDACLKNILTEIENLRMDTFDSVTPFNPMVLALHCGLEN